jgi:DNA-binding transcriptional ArsR family regulator
LSISADPLPAADIDRLSAQMAALGHPARLRVYRAVLRAGERGCPVGSIQTDLGLAQSTLSFHLHRLVESGLIRQQRRGRSLLCVCEFPAMERIVSFLRSECCRHD